MREEILEGLTKALDLKYDGYGTVGKGVRCVVKDCVNHTHQGRFVGSLCAPCYSFISGEGESKYSQAYRNAQDMAILMIISGTTKGRDETYNTGL
jgi:hypothetical protein